MKTDCKDINCSFLTSFEECGIIGSECNVTQEECPRNGTDIDRTRGFLSKVRINA